MTRVIIPWRAQPSRLAAFATVRSWYETNLPGAEIVTVDSGDSPFNLARCRNIGILAVSDADEPVVVADADTLPEREPLLAALAAADAGSAGAASTLRVHLPYTEYRWLGTEGTAQADAGVALAECTFTLVRGASSGVYVTTARTWAAHGGQDEGFRGWGFEDSAWLLAHTVLLGAPVRHVGRVFALEHETQLRAGEQYEANAARMQLYRDAAARGRDAMLTLTGPDAELTSRA